MPSVSIHRRHLLNSSVRLVFNIWFNKSVGTQSRRATQMYFRFQLASLSIRNNRYPSQYDTVRQSYDDICFVRTISIQWRTPHDMFIHQCRLMISFQFVCLFVFVRILSTSIINVWQMIATNYRWQRQNILPCATFEYFQLINVSIEINEKIALRRWPIEKYFFRINHCRYRCIDSETMRRNQYLSISIDSMRI
jgi:hypothetical protein